jgi:hypothetical protein
MLVIPATLEVAIRKIFIQDQYWQKISETPSQGESWVWWYVFVILIRSET